MNNDRAITSKSRPRAIGKELAELSTTHTLPGGMLVIARCFAFRGPARTRYEIVVEGFGRRAVIDANDRDALPQRIAEAMNAFEETSRLGRLAAIRR